MRSFTLACPPKPVKLCLAVTQPPEPLLVEFLPVQPTAEAAVWPPGPLFMVLSVYQLYGSPWAPTTCQVVPLSIEDCNTAPSMLNSLFHQIFISTTGSVKEVMLKQGLATKDCSLAL